MAAATILTASRSALLALAASFGLISSGASASAECQAGYEQQQRMAIGMHYNAELQAIYDWRDRHFKEALDRYQTEHGSSAATIYADFHRDRANLAERILSGDLMNSTQAERTSEAQTIGRAFRQRMAELNEALRARYNAEIAEIREQMGEMRSVWLEMRTQDLRDLTIEIHDGCRAPGPRLRSVFEWYADTIMGQDSLDNDAPPTPYYPPGVGIRG